MQPDATIREGDDYLVRFDEVGVGLHFFRLRETDAAMRALVAAVRLSDRKRLFAPVAINLFTLADRERIAKAVVERMFGGDPRDLKTRDRLIDWKDSVEWAFSGVVNEFTRPEPLVDLSQIPMPALEGYLVWPFLARNEVNVLLADQGAGKSYVGLFLCICISAGRADLLPAPFRLHGAGPPLYYDAETDVPAQRRRAERLALAMRLPQLPPIHYRHIKPPLANYASIIRRDVAEVGAVVAVFDSLTFLSGGNLNDSEVAVPTMNAIGECGATCTKLAIAHHGKAGREAGATPSVIGFSGFEFKARSIWLMRRMNEEGSGVSHIDQAWTNKKTSDDRNHRGFGLRLQFDENNTEAEVRSLGFEESPWLAKTAGSTEERITAALAETELWKLSTPELAKAIGMSEQTVRRICPTMDTIREAYVGGQGRGKASVWELVLVTGDRRNGHPEAKTKATPLSETNDVGFPPSGGTNITNTEKTNGGAFNEHARASNSGGSGDEAPADADDLMSLPF